jgi:hypothetical protein
MIPDAQNSPVVLKRRVAEVLALAFQSQARSQGGMIFNADHHQ